ncbi:MAG TPA: LysE family transporter [Syntrophorhabdales bacterium]|nr:LysE family transporter [Syntrophorhabdales bacterium]
MDLSFFFKGLLIGAAVSAPVGPIGLLCINRSLTEGRVRGFVSGLGAATADMVFCIIAGFGFTFVSRFLDEQAVWISFVGACGLLFLGLRIFFSKPEEKSCANTGGDLAHIYLSTFALTLINPVTILFFVAVFTSLGVTLSREDYPSLTLLIVGVLAGAVLWWFLLTGCVSLLHRRLTQKTIRWVNRISGTIVMVLGLLAFLNAVR